MEEAPESRNPLVRFFRRFGRVILLVLGGAAIFGLVTAIGPQQIYDALRRAGIWLPLILVLDFSWLFFEHLAVRTLLGEERRRVSFRVWLETTLVHYVAFMVVPMGRTSAEITRATVLAKSVGRAQAATAAAVMQSLTMVANALMSLLCLGALLLQTQNHGLMVGLLLNAAFTGVVGWGTYLVMQHADVGEFLGRRFSKLAQAGPEMDVHFRASRPRHLRALAICMGARLIQTVQFGVVVLAITGESGVLVALIAEGIQLIGRSAGDMVPNQVGVTEGAFALFSGALGLAEEPARAVSIALLVRISNLSVAGACATLLQFRPRSMKLAA